MLVLYCNLLEVENFAYPKKLSDHNSLSFLKRYRCIQTKYETKHKFCNLNLFLSLN